jgi:tetratricopeptide (TPR) repeat protein
MASIDQYAKALPSASRHHDCRAWNNKGVCLMHTNMITNAIQCFDRALDLDCRDNVLWLNKSLALRLLGLPALADALKAKVDDAWDPDVPPTKQYVSPFRVPPKSDIGLDYHKSTTLSFYKRFELNYYKKGGENCKGTKHTRIPQCLVCILPLHLRRALYSLP